MQWLMAAPGHTEVGHPALPTAGSCCLHRDPVCHHGGHAHTRRALLAPHEDGNGFSSCTARNTPLLMTAGMQPQATAHACGHRIGTMSMCPLPTATVTDPTDLLSNAEEDIVHASHAHQHTKLSVTRLPGGGCCAHACPPLAPSSGQVTAACMHAMSTRHANEENLLGSASKRAQRPRRLPGRSSCCTQSRCAGLKRQSRLMAPVCSSPDLPHAYACMLQPPSPRRCRETWTTCGDAAGPWTHGRTRTR